MGSVNLVQSPIIRKLCITKKLKFLKLFKNLNVKDHRQVEYYSPNYSLCPKYFNVKL